MDGIENSVLDDSDSMVANTQLGTDASTFLLSTARGITATVLPFDNSLNLFPRQCRRWWLLAFPSTGSDSCHEMKRGAIHECPILRPTVRGCDASIGWNVGSPSQFTLRVIDALNLTSSGQRPPSLHFEIGRFRFRDLLPPWAATRAIEGNPTSDVFITDPSEILDNARLIIAVDLERQTPFR